MSDTQPTPTPEGTQETEDKGKTFTPITTQAELDKLMEHRVMRERDKYRGFDEYKAAADELEKLKEADKSELEKAISRAEKAEAKAKQLEASARVERWKQEVSDKEKVPASLLRGQTKEEIEQHAQAIKAAYKDQSLAAPHVPGDGGGDQPSESKEDLLMSALLGG